MDWTYNMLYLSYVCVLVSILCVYVVICVDNTISYNIQINTRTILILHTPIFSHDLLEDALF